LDKSFRQVKHLPASATSWFSGNDNLVGTSTVGLEGNMDAEWAIEFSGITFTYMLFTTGDFQNFVYTSKNIRNSTGTHSALFEVLQTSVSQIPTYVEVY
jgi:hypothetical protein